MEPDTEWILPTGLDRHTLTILSSAWTEHTARECQQTPPPPSPRAPNISQRVVLSKHHPPIYVPPGTEHTQQNDGKHHPLLLRINLHTVEPSTLEQNDGKYHPPTTRYHLQQRIAVSMLQRVLLADNTLRSPRRTEQTAECRKAALTIATI